MSTLRTLKKLLFGETWLLPLGIAAVLAATGLLVRPLAAHAWEHAGGFVMLTGALWVLIASVARTARPRGRHARERPTEDERGGADPRPVPRLPES